MPPKDETPDTEETESDDTSEEEDTEEEDSEDTEGETTDEEDSDSEDEEDGEEEDDSEEEDSKSKSKQYLDLKKLPAELQEAGKRMLATHTKAMQAIPKLVEQKVAEAEQELQVKYSSAILKASGFDKITNLPGWKEFWEDTQNGQPYGYSSKFRKNGKVAESEDDEPADSGGDKLNTDHLLKRIGRMIDEAVSPLKEDRARSVWKNAEENLPNFNKYRAAITAKLAEHPTLSIAEAYDLVAGKDRVSDTVKKELSKAEERAKKLPKKSLKPGGSSSTKPLTKETIKSIDDALAHARRDLA